MRWPERTRRWLPWMLLAVAVIATAAVYRPGLTGGWVFDDYPNIVVNDAIHITPGHSTLVAWVNAAWSSPSSFLHRPLSSITFALNWYLGGGNPWGFKLTNVLIHVLNGVLLFCMLRELLRLLQLGGGALGASRRRLAQRHPPAAARRPPSQAKEVTNDAPPGADPLPSEGGESPPPSKRREIEGDGFSGIDDAAATRLALLVTAGWLLLPINLMAVLYVVQRMASLAQIFVLAGLWAYLAGRRRMLTAANRDDELRGLSLAAAGIVLGICIGVLAKETAVLLPAYAFLAELVVLRFRRRVVVPPGDAAASPRRWSANPFPLEGGEKLPASERTGSGGDGRTDKRIWALFVVTLLIPAIMGFAWLLRRALRPSPWASRSFTLIQRLMTEPRVLVDYLHWTLFPNPATLSLYHDEIVKSTGLLAPWTTLGAMLLLAALVVIAVLLRNRRPLVSLGIGWFFAGQLLTATIVPLELVYEQRMYFSSIGVLLAVGALLLGLRWRTQWPLARGVIVALALLLFTGVTWVRANAWSNPVGLAIRQANLHPNSPRANYTAGRMLMITAGYKPGTAMKLSEKYLRRAAALPGSSSLPEQALIMYVDHRHHGDDATYWQSMIHKLRTRPTRQEDISALIALTNCYARDICKFPLSRLQHAYQAALSRPDARTRLYSAYADFQNTLEHNEAMNTKYMALAVKYAPDEPAYRVDLAAAYAKQGKTRRALEQIDALRRLNSFGRLDKQIAVLERLAEEGKITTPHKGSRPAQR